MLSKLSRFAATSGPLRSRTAVRSYYIAGVTKGAVHSLCLPTELPTMRHADVWQPHFVLLF